MTNRSESLPTKREHEIARDFSKIVEGTILDNIQEVKEEAARHMWCSMGSGDGYIVRCDIFISKIGDNNAN